MNVEGLRCVYKNENKYYKMKTVTCEIIFNLFRKIFPAKGITLLTVGKDELWASLFYTSEITAIICMTAVWRAANSMFPLNPFPGRSVVHYAKLYE